MFNGNKKNKTQNEKISESKSHYHVIQNVLKIISFLYFILYTNFQVNIFQNKKK